MDRRLLEWSKGIAGWLDRIYPRVTGLMGTSNRSAASKQPESTLEKAEGARKPDFHFGHEDGPLGNSPLLLIPTEKAALQRGGLLGSGGRFAAVSGIRREHVLSRGLLAEQTRDFISASAWYRIEINWDHSSREFNHWWTSTQPAIGLVEFSSIPWGIKCCDQMLKESPVQLIEATTLCPGKYLVLVSGDAVTVEYAMEKARAVAGNWMADSLFIPDVDEKVVAAVTGLPAVAEYDALGVVETVSVASGLLAADRVVKATEISLCYIRLAKELGGKAYFVMAGKLGEIEEALETAREFLQGSNQLLGAVAVPVPDEALIKKMGLAVPSVI